MSSNAIKTTIEVTDDPGLRVAVERDALVLTIDRPNVGNSIALPTARAMRAALDAISDRADLRGIVVTGGCGKFFCAGGDLKAYRALETPEQLAEAFDTVRALLVAFEASPLPVIAAIDGYALGGGAEMALACDLRFASPGAVIGFPQSTLSLIPGWNGTERLVALVGPARATRLLLDASRLSATDALAIGLVDEVTAEAPARERALDYLAGLTAAPLAIRAVKRAVRACRPPLTADATSGIFRDLWFTDDHREAERAFAEKRRPVFAGR